MERELLLKPYQPAQGAPSSFAILELLSDIYGTVVAGVKPAEVTDDYRSYLKILEWRLRNLQIASPVDEVFQLATLIYLNRICGSLLDQPLKTEQRIHSVFTLLPQLSSCERQLPVFIVGCEARTDQQRAIILDLISRTERNAASRSFRHVKLLLEAIWAQDDLVDGQHEVLSYHDRLLSTIRRCGNAPSFV